MAVVVAGAEMRQAGRARAGTRWDALDAVTVLAGYFARYLLSMYSTLASLCMRCTSPTARVKAASERKALESSSLASAHSTRPTRGREVGWPRREGYSKLAQEIECVHAASRRVRSFTRDQTQ